MTKRVLGLIQKLLFECGLPHSIHHPNDPVADSNDEGRGPGRPDRALRLVDLRRATFAPSFA